MELSTLLPQYSSGEQGLSSGLQPGVEDGMSVVCVSHNAKPNIKYFTQWTKAFRIHMSLYLTKPMHYSYTVLHCQCNYAFIHQNPQFFVQCILATYTVLLLVQLCVYASKATALLHTMHSCYIHCTSLPVQLCVYTSNPHFLAQCIQALHIWCTSLPVQLCDYTSKQHFIALCIQALHIRCTSLLVQLCFYTSKPHFLAQCIQALHLRSTSLLVQLCLHTSKPHFLAQCIHALHIRCTSLLVQ